MNLKQYNVHSIFHTIQGEGVHAGTAAVFLRLAGCNAWSGREEDREKHAARGICARWCDTEFRASRGLGRMTVDEILAAVCGPSLEWGMDAPPIVVITGGEPSLQVDEALVEALHAANFAVHVETNGSRQLPDNVDWTTLSPKPPMPVVNRRVDEVKCVLPDVDPEPWRGLVQRGRLFVQPRDDGDGLDLRTARWNEAVKYVTENPWARLSIQTHKLLGIE